MECRNINEKHGALLTVAASLILLAAIVLSIGTAYGRYETVLNGVGNIAVLSKASIFIFVYILSSLAFKHYGDHSAIGIGHIVLFYPYRPIFFRESISDIFAPFNETNCVTVKIIVKTG